MKRHAKKPLDCHLMIVEPEKYVDAFVKAGAANVTVHVEASPHLHRTLQQIRGIQFTFDEHRLLEGNLGFRIKKDSAGAVWSASLLLEHLGEREAAAALMSALEDVCRDGPKTRDVGGSATTREVGDAIAERVAARVA